MNLNAVNRLATHVLRFVDTKKPTEPIIATLPQKPEIPAAEAPRRSILLMQKPSVR